MSVEELIECEYNEKGDWYDPAASLALRNFQSQFAYDSEGNSDESNFGVKTALRGAHYRINARSEL